jgi:hypothetical protein
MIQLSDVNKLLNKWNERLNYYKQFSDPLSISYRDALEECVYELQRLVDDTLDEIFVDSIPSEEVQQYLLEQEADSYLSSSEAHEHIA